jgi:hypothetical protein
MRTALTLLLVIDGTFALHEARVRVVVNFTDLLLA